MEKWTSAPHRTEAKTHAIFAIQGFIAEKSLTRRMNFNV
jgi:hypothetical protein